jgi:long-chain acyl-CoA synthetase
MGLNLSALLSATADQSPDSVAVRFSGRSVTYQELDHRCNCAAGGFAALPVAGKRVALMLPNSTDFIVAYFAALRAGATVVPINILLRPMEVRHTLADSDAHVLVIGHRQARELELSGIDPAKIGPRHVFVVGAHDDSGEDQWTRFIELATPLDRAVPTDSDCDAVLLYTSGTTGKPKGARLTHSGLAWIAEVIATRTLAISGGDAVYLALPLSHIFGLNALLTATFCAGGTVILEAGYDPDAALAAIEEYGITVFAGVPAMAIGLLEAHRRSPRELPTLRVSLLGGQSVPVEVTDAFRREFHCRTIEAYGISEASSAVAATSTESAGKPGSVGHPLWGTSIRIIDDGGSDCAPNIRGEILVRGIGVMTGYHNLPEASAASLRDGWFYTGDIGYLDDDGDLFVVDRKKDMIIRGGYNVYPHEVEEVLYAHPDVLEAAVVGIPDAAHGEEIGAAVRLRPNSRVSTEDLREHTRKMLAAYKYPRIIAFVDALPASSTGKLLKRSIDIGELVRLAEEQGREHG